MPLHEAGEAGEWTVARAFHDEVRRRGGRGSTYNGGLVFGMCRVCGLGVGVEVGRW